MPSCVRHPDRPTGLRCTRCDRPACPECLREASVGYQCVDCVNEGQRTTRQPRTVAGAGISRNLVVVPVLIAINVVVFAITVGQAQSLANNGNSKLAVDWLLWPPLVAAGEWWRLFTAGFLHSGPVHIALNMIALYILGRELEPLLGRIRFTAIYLISLLGGSTSVVLFGETPVVGASGAVFGLMGAIGVVVLRLKLNPRPVLMIIALNIFISVTVPNISLLGHLGGLVIGAIATAALVYAPARSRVAWQAGALVVLTIALVGLILVRDAQLGEQSCRQLPGGEISCERVSG
jgi:membrane associated rhomboid family serine protease